MPSFPQKSAIFLSDHRRWGIVLLLYFFSTISNLDRQALAVLAPVLKENLHFGPVEYSYIVSSFLVAYGLGYAFCGRIIDRFGVKLALGLALAFWSVAGMLHAAALGWITLAIFRFLLGLGESFNVPSGVKAITEWVPPRERGVSVALFSNGHVTGAILAPPLVTFLAWHFGWRWSFVATGAIGFILLLLWWRFYDSPEKHRGITEKERALILTTNEESPQATVLAKPTVAQLIRHPLCVGFFFAQFLTDPVAFFLSFWLPDYLHSRGLTMALIGLVGWLPYLGADIGGPGGGAVSDWLIRHGWDPIKARRVLMLGAACLMLFANSAVRTETMWLSILLIGLLFAAQSCWKANLFTLIADSVPRSSVATLVALSSLGGSIGGVAANLIAGQVIAAYGYKPVFTAISILPLLAFAILEFSAYRARNMATHT